MNSKPEGSVLRAYWFVGATNHGNDETLRFIREGIWENWDHNETTLDLVKSIQVGERIAIKAAYTRKHDLPFDNRC